jgi:hypothetical protein
MPDLIELDKLPKKTLEKIKMMYFLGFTVSEISVQMDVSVDTLRKYVFGIDESGTDPLCWHQQKKEVDKTGVIPYLKGKVDALEKATGMAYNLLTRGLQSVGDRVEEYTVDEVKKLADIVATLDKITRLETGKPTDISESVVVTLKEATEILARDPFFVAEYKEIKKEEVELEEVDFGENPFER